MDSNYTVCYFLLYLYNYDKYNGEKSCKNRISSTCQLNVIKLLILSHPNLCRGRWIYLKLHAFHIILKYF